VKPPLPPGMNINADGYLRFHRLPLRDQYAHRVYASRQMMASLGRSLRRDEEVHHLCGNRACWPPTDFHLVIMDAALHHAVDAGIEPWKKHYRSRRKKVVTA